VPTFVDRGVSRGQRGGSPTVIHLNATKTKQKKKEKKLECPFNVKISNGRKFNSFKTFQDFGLNLIITIIFLRDMMQ
jgi:hypothetical protein